MTFDDAPQTRRIVLRLIKDLRELSKALEKDRRQGRIAIRREKLMNQCRAMGEWLQRKIGE
jgi:hypothetical protein